MLCDITSYIPQFEIVGGKFQKYVNAISSSFTLKMSKEKEMEI